MEYLSPVINHVHNNLNVNMVIRLNNGRFSIPAKTTTVLDFDVMSLTNSTERRDLFYSIANGHMSVDILVLKNGEYVKVGEYQAEAPKPVSTTVRPEAKTTSSEDRAKSLGIKVDTIEHKEQSINVVEDVKDTASKPESDSSVVKPYNKPEEKVSAKEDAPKKDIALKNVKSNAKKGE